MEGVSLDLGILREVSFLGEGGYCFRRKNDMSKGFYAVLTGFAIFCMVLAGCDNLGNISQNPTNTTEYIVKFDKNTYLNGIIVNKGTTEATPKNKKVTPPATRIDRLPAEPTWQDHVFMGWYEAKGEPWGEEFDETTTVKDNMTVYARWTDYDETICIVTFNSNGGEWDPPIANDARRVKIHVDSNFSNESARFPPEPEWDRHIFLGWFTKQKNGDSFDITTIVEDDITVYAQWEQRKAGYNLMYFDKNTTILGSTDASPKVIQIRPNTEAGILPSVPPTQPLRPGQPGYVFDSWNTLKNGTGTSVTAKTVIRDSWFDEMDEITVYAQWELRNTVTFDKNGGDTEIKPPTRIITSPDNKIDKLPNNPTRAGYTFGGWNLERDGKGDVFTKDYTVTKPIIVYAKWIGVTYTVIFDRNGGTTDAEPRTAEGSEDGTTLPAKPPTRTGYTLAGWNKAADGKGDPFTSTTPVTAPIIVYAVWTANPATATVNVNWDKLPDLTAAASVVQGNPVNITVSSTGFTIKGWYIDGKVIPGDPGNSYTYPGNDAGEHIVTLLAEKGGRVYSAEIKITVTPLPVPGGG
jgi:uncharacterized repeat protein (TIGR02543 family)